MREFTKDQKQYIRERDERLKKVKKINVFEIEFKATIKELKEMKKVKEIQYETYRDQFIENRNINLIIIGTVMAQINFFDMEILRLSYELQDILREKGE